MERLLQDAHRDGVVIGLQSTGPPVNRLDIDQFMVQEPAAFNLFLLALGKLKNENAVSIMPRYMHQLTICHAYMAYPECLGITSNLTCRPGTNYDLAVRR